MIESVSLMVWWCGAHPDEFFTIRSHLNFEPKFTSRGLKNFKKLPPVGLNSQH